MDSRRFVNVLCATHNIPRQLARAPSRCHDAPDEPDPEPALTYCLAICVREGLIALSDGRVTAGTEVTNARKISLHGRAGGQFFIMTSGLRSLRDKTVAYLERELRKADEKKYPRTLIDAVQLYTNCLRRVYKEDSAALAHADLKFNLHALIGGQLEDDPAPSVLLVYPEGNWIEVNVRTPYLSIGSTAYGKPILDRALSIDTSLQAALKLAYLSFDSTRYSASDVGYPIDIYTYSTADRTWRCGTYDYDDLARQRQWWNINITQIAHHMPDGPWVETLLPPGYADDRAVVDDAPVAPNRLSVVGDDKPG
jgi:putative proteasome-type protease